jgi:hypothetical protein
MSWKVTDAMPERLELVTLAGQAGADMAELCPLLGVGRKTGHQWQKRFALPGSAGLLDRSRRPWRCASRIRCHGSRAVDAGVREAGAVGRDDHRRSCPPILKPGGSAERLDPAHEARAAVVSRDVV